MREKEYSNLEYTYFLQIFLVILHNLFVMIFIQGMAVKYETG